MFYQWMQISYIFMQREHHSHNNSLPCRNQNFLIFCHIPGVHFSFKVHLDPTRSVFYHFWEDVIWLSWEPWWLWKTHCWQTSTWKAKKEKDFDFWTDWFFCPNVMGRRLPFLQEVSEKYFILLPFRLLKKQWFMFALLFWWLWWIGELHQHLTFTAGA